MSYYSSYNDNNNEGAISPLKCYIYKDVEFLNSIYAQQFESLPSLGVIEYINTITDSNIKEYKGAMEGEKRVENMLDCNEQVKTKDELRDRYFGEIKYCDTKGSNITRLFTNIEELKQIRNAKHEKTMIEDLIAEATKKAEPKLINIYGKLNIYEGCTNKTDENELLVKMEEDCMWLKKQYVNADLELLTKVLDKVNVLAYVVSNKTERLPRILKAIVIYV